MRGGIRVHIDCMDLRQGESTLLPPAKGRTPVTAEVLLGVGGAAPKWDHGPHVIRFTTIRASQHGNPIITTHGTSPMISAVATPETEPAHDLGLEEDGYVLVSAHREENVDSPTRLSSLLDCLEAVVEEYRMPVLVSTHPRTRKRLEALGRSVNGATFHKPLGYHDYNKLQLKARCGLSDSGTIAEESSLLGFLAVTLRDSIERPEALDTGAIIMTGLDPANLLLGISCASHTAAVGDSNGLCHRELLRASRELHGVTPLSPRCVGRSERHVALMSRGCR